MTAAGVAIDVHLQRTLKVGNDLVEFVGAQEKGLAGGFGVGVRTDDDFFEDMDDVFDALHEERAHRVDIEIERPDEWAKTIEADGVQVVIGMEGVIDAVGDDGVELSAVLAAKGIFVGTVGDTLDFRLFD